MLKKHLSDISLLFQIGVRARISFQLYMASLVLLVSCGQDDTTEPTAVVDDGTPSIVANSDTRLIEVEIDTTDLYMLPADTGGQMTIYDIAETNAPFRHLVYTPSHYSEEGPDYPLIIFLHGWGPWLNSGAAPPENLLTSSGPPKLIAAGTWNPTYPFIVVAPELRSLYWDWDQVHDFISHLIDSYQINTQRIYLTGLSLGGGGSWYYAGKMGDESYVAAIVPISARGELSIVENLTKVPIWAFHGDSDQTVDAFTNYGSVVMVNTINQNNPLTKARLTVYKNTGHDAWTRTYANWVYPSGDFDTFEVSIYDWMLQHRKSP